MRLLLEAAASGNGNGSAITSLVPLIMIAILFAVMYFFTIRPQKKQDQEQKKMRDNLAVGDEITTIGGIIGKIVSIKEETVVIETSGECNKIRILRTAVRCVDVHAEDAD